MFFSTLNDRNYPESMSGIVSHYGYDEWPIRTRGDSFLELLCMHCVAHVVPAIHGDAATQIPAPIKRP